MRRLVLYLGFICLVIASWVFGIAVVGREAPEFQAKDYQGQVCSLEQYRGKIIVLEWVNAKCPYVKKQYSKETRDGVGNMQMMQKQFTQPSVGVVWLSIASSTPGSSGYMNPEAWKGQLQTWGAHPTTLIIDENGELARAYGANRTPEVFVIGKDGTLLYRGAVDSLRGTDPLEIERTSNLHWLKNAIENAIRGRRVVPPETIPYGCSIR